MDLSGARAAALAAHPGAPLITDLTEGRVELSHATFDNWVTKTVNFLRLECDVDPGQVISLDLPLHWMTAVWCVSVWEAGCDLTFTGPADLTVGGPGCDVLVTCDPWGMAPAPAQARAEWFFPSDVRGMPDALVLPAPPTGGMDAASAGDVAREAHLFAERTGLRPGQRLQVLTAPSDLSGVLALVGAALAADAGVVYGAGDEHTISAV